MIYCLNLLDGFIIYLNVLNLTRIDYGGTDGVIPFFRLRLSFILFGGIIIIDGIGGFEYFNF